MGSGASARRTNYRGLLLRRRARYGAPNNNNKKNNNRKAAIELAPSTLVHDDRKQSRKVCSEEGEDASTIASDMRSHKSSLRSNLDDVAFFASEISASSAASVKSGSSVAKDFLAKEKLPCAAASTIDGECSKQSCEQRCSSMRCSSLGGGPHPVRKCHLHEHASVATVPKYGRKSLPDTYHNDERGDMFARSASMPSLAAVHHKGKISGKMVSRSGQRSEGNSRAMHINDKISEKIGLRSSYPKQSGSCLREERKRPHLAVGSKLEPLSHSAQKAAANKLRSLDFPMHHLGRESSAILRKLEAQDRPQDMLSVQEEPLCGFSFGDRVLVSDGGTLAPWYGMGDGFVVSATSKKGVLAIEFDKTGECFNINAKSLIRSEGLVPTVEPSVPVSALKAAEAGKISLACGTKMMGSLDAVVANRDSRRMSSKESKA